MHQFKIFLFLILASANYAFGQQSLLDSADSYYYGGQYLRAITVYKQLIAARGGVYGNDFALTGLASCYEHVDSLSQAIALYKILNQQNQQYKRPAPTALLYLGTCYIKMDSIPQAKKVLEAAIKSDYPLRDIPVLGCKMLSEIYHREKDFHRAIACYRLYGKLWEEAKFNDVNRFAFRYSNAINIANCYKKLKLIDSAILVQTPYMFCNYLNLKNGLFRFGPEKSDLKDSVQHDSVCIEYIAMLRLKHSLKNIRQELLKAERSLQYSEETQFSGKDSMYVSKKATAVFAFYGTDIKYESFSWFNKREGIPERDKPYFTREFYPRRFRDTRLYHMIAAL